MCEFEPKGNINRRNHSIVMLIEIMKEWIMTEQGHSHRKHVAK